MPSTSDRIEKEIVLDTPRSRVWRAITTVSDFNEWFGVSLNGTFAPGAELSGRITTPGYDHLTMTIWVESLDPEELFSFHWHPYAIDSAVDYSSQPTTLVSFKLTDVAGGTRLTVTESGFDKVPADRRDEAFLRNSEGWAIQVQNIRKHLEKALAR